VRRSLFARRELFTSKSKGAIVEIPSDFSAEDWRRAGTAFATVCGRRNPSEAWVETRALYPDQEHFGIPYSWGLDGPGGSWFIVHRFPEHDDEDVHKCIANIRAEQDVVSLRVHTVSEWIKFELPPKKMPKKRIRVDALKPNDNFELLEETLGLEPDFYTYIGDKAGARWELDNSVKIESRHGNEFVIPEGTMVRSV
jgi:hypothetical protein